MSAIHFLSHGARELDEQPTCTFQWIKHAFGQSGSDGCSDDRFVEFIDDLIELHGFPRPLPGPKWGGGIEAAVTRKSRWLRAAVITWLGDYLPPEAAAALNAAEAAAAAADMDAAAGNLRLVAANDFPELSHMGGK